MSHRRSMYRQQGWGTIGSYLLSLFLMYIFFSLSADAFQYLGFSPLAALLVLLLAVFTSSINIPVTYLEGDTAQTSEAEIMFFGITYRIPYTEIRQDTMIAINVGGAILPLAISILLWISNPLSLLPSLASIFVASFIINHYARPVKGLGIAIPTFVPAIVSFSFAVVAALIDPQISPIVAYTTGVLGSLIGADIMNLDKISDLGAPVASIGGAGTFDGIFVSGILSVVLLAIFGIV